MAWQGRAGRHKADHDGIGETCGVSTMQKDLHTFLHMRGSLDRRMLYVGVAHLVSSNFCPLLVAHARTRKVVRRSAQVVLALIYPRYPSLPSPPTRQLPPFNIPLPDFCFAFGPHMPACSCTVRSACGPPWSVLSSIQLRSLGFPKDGGTILCAPCGPLIIPFTRL